jgi:hypothetical protein
MASQEVSLSLCSENLPTRCPGACELGRGYPCRAVSWPCFRPSSHEIGSWYAFRSTAESHVRKTLFSADVVQAGPFSIVPLTKKLAYGYREGARNCMASSIPAALAVFLPGGPCVSRIQKMLLNSATLMVRHRAAHPALRPMFLNSAELQRKVPVLAFPLAPGPYQRPSLLFRPLSCGSASLQKQPSFRQGSICSPRPSCPIRKGGYRCPTNRFSHIFRFRWELFLRLYIHQSISSLYLVP